MKNENIKMSKCQAPSPEEWENFVESANNGTIFHLRKFLSYHHKGKFQDSSFIFRGKNRILSVFPAAIVNHRLISHPGTSYGSFVHLKNLTLSKAMGMVNVLVEYCKKENIKGIEMTLPPAIYYAKPTDYIPFCLLKTGFYLKKRELSGYIPLSDEPFKIFKPEARTAARKAEREGVTAKQSDDIEAFYSILKNNLGMRHNVKPTHTLQELIRLKKIFPERVLLFADYYNDIMISGAVIFVANKTTLLAFYISHKEKYQFLRPLNLLFKEVIEWGWNKGYKYLDLGTFTLNMMPNFGLARFKESIGATGIFRDTYAINLDD